MLFQFATRFVGAVDVFPCSCVNVGEFIRAHSDDLSCLAIARLGTEEEIGADWAIFVVQFRDLVDSGSFENVVGID